MSSPPQPPSSPPEAPVCYRHTDREAHIRCQRCDRPICPDCMRSAAVGFQCPSCVKEGSRSTRSGRTAYGGQRSANPALTSKVLVGVNAAVWAAILLTSGSAQQIGLALSSGFTRSRLVDVLALTPVGAVFQEPDGSLVRVPGVADGAYWQLATSMFAHVAVWHIAFNMMALWFLGPQFELAMGRVRFLGLYLVSGLTGAASVMWLSGEHSATLGASGAIFGLMGGLLVMALKVNGDVRGVATWIGANFLITFILGSFISWQGHLGGFVGGLVLGTVFVYAPRKNRAAWQLAGFLSFTTLVVLAIALRVAILNGAG
ncbi:MAG: rhomboid family intramembrane serine protease [Nocardioidaceae bacterium]|nr:rhomboid family intramembrane serine protease [Nocardioidaceae bacterium]NUS49645.1 rhomboid family intramembrane serine protease [Nocardioidaceae bacterium]